MGTNTIEPQAPVQAEQLPVTERQVATAYVSEQAIRRAHVEPVPGALADAFLEGDIEVRTTKGILKVRPIVASDWYALKKLNGVLYQWSLELAKPENQREDLEWNDEDGVEIAHQFTTPSFEVWKLVKEKGKQVFQDEAMKKFGGYLENELNKVVEAVVRQMHRHHVARIKYEASEGNEDAQNFLKAIQDRLTTASDGSSNTATPSPNTGT